MLHERDKLRFYIKGTKNLLFELTIKKVKQVEDGKLQVWIEEPHAKSGKSIPAIAVDRDGKEYDVKKTWVNSPKNWGFILQQI